MVYGFVKQLSGHIDIYSEPGIGTTVKLYFPRVADRARNEERHEVPTPSLPSGKVLVVEDDPLVLEFASAQMEALGYTVRAARSGLEALDILRTGETFDLLFTDVVMPGGIDGPTLARKAREMQPPLRVLFTSGYSENAIIHNGRLDEGVQLLSKPYSRKALARKIGEALDTRS
jgi:CheY-like chemotaxis protein